MDTKTTPTEYLINPVSGDVQSREDWLSDYASAHETEETVEKWMGDLLSFDLAGFFRDANMGMIDGRSFGDLHIDADLMGLDLADYQK